MGRAEPNDGHRALAARRPRAADHPERRRPARGAPARAGWSRCTAGSRRWSACRAATTSSRADLERRLDELNPGWLERHGGVGVAPRRRRRPRRDRRLRGADVRRAADRSSPHVVFFGENVPADRVARCYAAVEALGHGRRAAGGRLVADGDERAAVRQARGRGRDADRHRQPGRDPRRRAGDVHARGGVQRVPRRAGARRRAAPSVPPPMRGNSNFSGRANP